MREGPSGDVLAGSVSWRPSVSAWRGTELLAESVPVVSGSLRADVGQEVPERLTFTVPEFADGVSWVPDGPDHPLAGFGQFVEVDVHVVSSVTGEVWVSRLGRFVVQAWDHDDVAGSVQVECVGVLQRALDARFRAPEVPRPDGTLVSEFRRLMVPGVPVEFDAALEDRAVPQSFQWDEDRLGALYEIADAWPARLRVDQFGTLQVLPPLPETPVPVVRIVDGDPDGTLISAPRAGSRDGVFNVVVARSSATDDPAKPPAQAVAEVGYGPLAPASYGEVVKFWSSPLASTRQQLERSAKTLLADSVRPAIVQDVTCAPDPRIELDDAVLLERGRSWRRKKFLANAGPRVDGGWAMTGSFDGSTDGGGVV